MNSKNKKERRVININKEDFDLIQSYCTTHALDMPRWLVKIAKSQINEFGIQFNTITYNKFTANELIDLIKKTPKKLISVDQSLKLLLETSNKCHEGPVENTLIIDNKIIYIVTNKSFRGMIMQDGVLDPSPIIYKQLIT